jgi:hypothetical protein
VISTNPFLRSMEMCRDRQGASATEVGDTEHGSATLQQGRGGYSLLGAPSLAPEEVIARSGLNAATVTGFLFENYLDFIDADAIDDVATAAANFSDAIHIVHTQPGGILFVHIELPFKRLVLCNTRCNFASPEIFC